MPLHRISSLKNGYTLGLWHITEKPEELLALASLSTEEQGFYQQLSNTQRRLHWLAWRALIKKLTGNPAIEITYQENGKPLVRDQSLQISVSHAGPWAACLLHSSEPVGVDVESVRPRILKIKERFLSSREIQWHAKSTDDLRHLTILWCIKEAVFKFAGISGLDYRNQINILPFHSLSEGQASCQLIPRDGYLKEILLYYEDIDSEHVIAYVAETNSVQ